MKLINVKSNIVVAVDKIAVMEVKGKTINISYLGGTCSIDFETEVDAVEQYNKLNNFMQES